MKSTYSPAVRPLRKIVISLAAAWPLCAFPHAPAQTSNPHRHASQDSASDHLSRGKVFGSQENWKEAEAELRIYRNQHPDVENATVLHAEALIKIGQPFDASLELQQFLREHPKALRSHELLAVLAGGPLRDSTLAASELRTCVHLAPSDFQAWESLGDVYTDGANAAQAVDAYLHAIRLKPTDPVASASLAHAYAEQGLQEKAAAQFAHSLALVKQATHSEKDTASVAFLYGQYMAEHGDARQGIPALTQAIKFNPNSADAYYWRARAYENLHDTKNAEQDALEAIKLSPTGKEAPLFLITLYRKAGDMETAQKYAELAQKIADQEQAQASFGRSLRDSLDQAEPLLRQGKFAEAAPLYESLIKLLPTFYEAYFDLGMCYGELGRPKDAESEFRKYLAFQPVSADGHAALGVLLLSEDRGPEAVAELNQAIQIDPDAIEARRALANEYLKEENPRSALTILRPVENAKDVQLLLMLATALEQTGDYRSARIQVDRVLAIDPHNSDAIALRNALNKPAAQKAANQQAG